MAAKARVLLVIVAFQATNCFPQNSKQWLFDTKAFDDKHQHVLMPTSLFTGAAGVIVGKLHEHSLKYTKKPELIDDLITTPRPKIIDFISKIKKRSPQETDRLSLENTSCGCSAEVPIADIAEGIAEHIAEKRKIAVTTSTNFELEEVPNVSN